MLLMLPSSTIGRILFLLATCIAIWGAMAFGRRLLRRMGRNSERFQGRNLTLRLAALGYTDVYWYRGGQEAWEAAGLPTTELVVQNW